MTAARQLTFAAADLGASSGRVLLGRVGPDRLELTEVHRFANTPVRLPDGLHWDVLALHRGVLEGLRSAAAEEPVASIGIDGWGVDYGLLDADGRLLGNPFHYRDERTAGVADAVRDAVGAQRLYELTGLQHLPINTLYQLAAARGSAQLAAARTLLLIPDLLIHWLTGEPGAERTNASTTGLLDARTGRWSAELAAAAGLDPALLPPLREPGDRAGTLLPEVAAATGLPEGTPVTAVASHDTASAVAAVPAAGADFAYVSCGTWSLAGLELDAPVLSEESRRANFTNERGIDGTARYLRNIMGLWLLEECRRSWTARGLPTDRGELLAAAARARPFAALIAADAPEFLAPADMPTAIAEHCARGGQSPPDPGDQGAVVRCVLESLALAHALTIRQACELSGRKVGRVHLVGGGSRNALLCQFTADALGAEVVAGPAEATAVGNILVQARAHGLVGDRESMRRLVADTQPLHRYAPDARRSAAWERAADRVRSLSR